MSLATPLLQNIANTPAAGASALEHHVAHCPPQRLRGAERRSRRCSAWRGTALQGIAVATAGRASGSHTPAEDGDGVHENRSMGSPRLAITSVKEPDRATGRRQVNVESSTRLTPATRTRHKPLGPTVHILLPTPSTPGSQRPLRFQGTLFLPHHNHS